MISGNWIAIVMAIGDRRIGCFPLAFDMYVGSGPTILGTFATGASMQR